MCLHCFYGNHGCYYGSVDGCLDVAFLTKKGEPIIGMCPNFCPKRAEPIGCIGQKKVKNFYLQQDLNAETKIVSEASFATIK